MEREHIAWVTTHYGRMMPEWGYATGWRDHELYALEHSGQDDYYTGDNPWRRRLQERRNAR